MLPPITIPSPDAAVLLSVELELILPYLNNITVKNNKNRNNFN